MVDRKLVDEVIERRSQVLNKAPMITLHLSGNASNLAGADFAIVLCTKRGR
jgi:hypothetical protein